MRDTCLAGVGGWWSGWWDVSCVWWGGWVMSDSNDMKVKEVEIFPNMWDLSHAVLMCLPSQPGWLNTMV